MLSPPLGQADFRMGTGGGRRTGWSWLLCFCGWPPLTGLKGAGDPSGEGRAQLVLASWRPPVWLAGALCLLLLRHRGPSLIPAGVCGPSVASPPPITHIQRPAAGVPLVPVALLDKAPLATFLSSVQAGPHLSMGTSGDSGPCCLSNVLIIPPAASQRSQPSRLVALRYFLVVSQCGRAHTQVLMRN